MNTIKKRTFTASSFRIVLSIGLILCILGGAGLFVYGYTQVKTFSIAVSKRKADAKASDNSVSSLELVKSKLNDLSSTKTLLSYISSSSDLPQFEAERNLRAIADKLNVPIKSVTFVDSGLDSPATASPSANSSSSAGSTTAVTSKPGAKIAFEINFLNAIELNMPKLQIQSITLPPDSTRNSVKPSQITLQLLTTK
jgi:hypothetical protein